MFSNEMIGWLMLNPSTADETEDDPTIRRVTDFSLREGYGALIVVNLSPQRSPHPSDLRPVPDEVFDRNVEEIQKVVAKSRILVVAYGAHVKKVPRAQDVLSALDATLMVCLGRTNEGHPRHPLMVRKDRPFEEYVD